MINTTKNHVTSVQNSTNTQTVTNQNIPDENGKYTGKFSLNNPTPAILKTEYNGDYIIENGQKMAHGTGYKKQTIIDGRTQSDVGNFKNDQLSEGRREVELPGNGRIEMVGEFDLENNSSLIDGKTLTIFWPNNSTTQELKMIRKGEAVYIEIIDKEGFAEIHTKYPYEGSTSKMFDISKHNLEDIRDRIMSDYELKERKKQKFMEKTEQFQDSLKKQKDLLSENIRKIVNARIQNGQTGEVPSNYTALMNIIDNQLRIDTNTIQMVDLKNTYNILQQIQGAVNFMKKSGFDTSYTELTSTFENYEEEIHNFLK